MTTGAYLEHSIRNLFNFLENPGVQIPKKKLKLLNLKQYFVSSTKPEKI